MYEGSVDAFAARRAEARVFGGLILVG
ncbi:uncharacterized protein METZ01_LOCUS69713 [marine metagenome]|uniref:Uncharacterized protein n=1 Tax=marine metagenome TaxID=408172 RepID=A0A381TLZ8_9ZZZZ